MIYSPEIYCNTRMGYQKAAYTYNIGGFDIAKRFNAGTIDKPIWKISKVAWFSQLTAAEQAIEKMAGDVRIIDVMANEIQPWRGLSGAGENAATLDQWILGY